MALIDAVRVRLSEDQIARLSNPNDPDGANTGEDTPRLQAACDDVEGLFKIHAQTTFNIDNVAHVSHAVDGVERVLQKRMGQQNADSDYQEWVDQFEKIKTTDPRARVELGSDSYLQPTQPGDNGTVIRPWSDPAHFRDVSPDPPGGRGANYWSSDDRQ